MNTFTLLALLVLIHLSTSSKRLLLQGIPPVNPPANPANPAAPANPSAPAPPTNGLALPPGYVPPPPAQNVDPSLLPPQFQPPTYEAVCQEPYGMRGSCAYRNTLQLQLRPGQAGACQPGAACGPLEYNNVANNFKMYCNGYASCYGTETNINIGGAMNVPMGVHKIESIGCTEPYSCMYGTVNIRNNQNNGNNIEVANLEFQDVGAGNDFTINVWGADVNDVSCDKPQNCANCWIQFFRADCQNPNNPLCLIEKKPCYGY